MTRATTEPTTTAITSAATARRTRRGRVLAGVAAAALVVTACGGDDDEAAEETTTTTVVAAATTTTAVAPTTTAAVVATTAPPQVDYVTEGATVIVANASGIDGAAGRLTDRLADVGFQTAPATNSADTVSNLPTTQIYYDPAVEGAQAVAESLKQAFGGGDIEVLELTVPAPTESGELGGANVLVLMGNDVADKSLEELQGVAPVDTTDDTTEGTTDVTTEDTTVGTTEDTTEDTGGDTTDS